MADREHRTRRPSRPFPQLSRLWHGARALGRRQGSGGGRDPALSIPEEAARLEPPDSIQAVGRRAFSREVCAPAWIEGNGRVEVLLQEDELAALPSGARGSFSSAAAPAARAGIRLASEPPASLWRTHFRLEAHAPAFRPLEVGWVTLAATSRVALVIPYSAVLESMPGSHVFVASADRRTFSARPVRIGEVFFGMAVVTSGLREGERIAVGDAFLLEAERRLRAAHE